MQASMKAKLFRWRCSQLLKVNDKVNASQHLTSLVPNLLNQKSILYTYVCAPMSLYRCIKQHDMNSSVFIAAQSPQRTWPDMMDVQLFPEAICMFGFCWKSTNTYTTVKCRYMYDRSRELMTLLHSHHPTCPSLSPRGWQRVRTSTGFKALICTVAFGGCDNSLDVITSHHAGKSWTSASADSDVFQKSTHGNTHQCKMH